MSNIQIINQILNNKYLPTKQNELYEKDYNNKGKQFEMKVPIISNNQISYKLYRFESKDFPFFNEITNLKKMCDFILFAEEGNHLTIFLIELKLGNVQLKDN